MELGIKPEHAVVSLNAAKKALREHMPDNGIHDAERAFRKAGVVTPNTGRRALKVLLEAGQIRRIGQGEIRYFLKG